MDMLKQLNFAIDYIELNLCAEIDMNELGRISCVTKDSFFRFFSYMTGMTINEYIRRRKLSLAANELRCSASKVIDVAIKYGWSSADAFTKAFTHQHGITPTQARDLSKAIKIFSPVSFYIMIKGAREMDFRIIEIDQTEVYGVSKQFNQSEFKTREELRHIMWSEECDFVSSKICDGYDGIWYGVWSDGNYLIGREKKDVRNDKLEKQIIPAGEYAVFKTECGVLAWEELPKLFELIFDSWLPSSEYKQKNDIIVEIYHLWTDRDMRKKNRYYEVRIPIEKR